MNTSIQYTLHKAGDIVTKITVDSKTIRKRMIDKDIKTLTELAQLSGVSKPKIHQYLSGKTPLATTFIRLCDFLELNPDELILFNDIHVDGSDTEGAESSSKLRKQ
ncbi:MAG: helix-turn-helix domain-containing protein [Clostridium sp.]|nr:helix-turn-helix domain-containing protein [Clostridium sp.]